jgi:hypothetical protein
VGGRLGRELVEERAHLGVLVFGPFADRRAAADGSILLLDLGSTLARNEGAEVALELAERDQVRVGLVGGVRGGGLAGLATDVGLTKSLLKKPPTSSSVDGPPMLRKTMAVGPLEPVASWVTGGAGVAGVARCLCWLRAVVMGARTAGARCEPSDLRLMVAGVGDGVLRGGQATRKKEKVVACL